MTFSPGKLWRNAVFWLSDFSMAKTNAWGLGIKAFCPELAIASLVRGGRQVTILELTKDLANRLTFAAIEQRKKRCEQWRESAAEPVDELPTKFLLIRIQNPVAVENQSDQA